MRHTQKALRAKSGRVKALTREEEPKLPTEALGDALQDQLPGLGCSVHAHAPPVLKEVDAPRFLLHLLLGLREGTWRVELKRVSVHISARLAACCGEVPQAQTSEP